LLIWGNNPEKPVRGQMVNVFQALQAKPYLTGGEKTRGGGKRAETRKGGRWNLVRSVGSLKGYNRSTGNRGGLSVG